MIDLTTKDEHVIHEALGARSLTLRNEAAKLARAIGKWDDPEVAKMVKEADEVDSLQKLFKKRSVFGNLKDYL